MPQFNVQILTKLGSHRSKLITADSEEEAIAAAKDAFPLNEKVWIEGEAQEVANKKETSYRTPDRLMEMKRNAEIEKAKAKRGEGLIWFIVGAIITLVTYFFVRNAFIIAFGPVIWGAYIYKSADTRIKRLNEEHAAGLPFIER